jgi:anti-anti-sigma regulatory factor
MEAAQQTGGSEQEQELKLKIDKFSDGPITCLKLAGTIDEDFEGKKLAGSIKAQTLVLDLADIRKISSFGIREWVDFVNAVEKNCEKVILLECAPKVVDQLNMVANFSGETGQVFSFYAPYRCDYCDSDSSLLMQVDRDWEVIKSMKPPERPCGACGEPEYFDEDPTTYFSFIAGQQPFELDHEVAAFLSSKLNYTVSESARRLRIDKIIEGRSTYLKLAGDLDGSFPREKLAEGLEGVIIIDISGMGKIDPAGAAEWRGFVQMISPAAESIFLLGTPPGFLEKLTKPEDLGPKAQVITFAMPYSCAKCATTATQLIDVEQHYDVLKFATPPEMKCSDCKNPTTCAATEGLLSHLPTLPKPSISPQTRKFIKDVQERKPEKKKAATTVAEAAAQGRGGGIGMMLGAAVIAAGLAVGGFFVYQKMNEKPSVGDSGAVAVGAKLRASVDARPAWLTSDTFFSAGCTSEGDALSCFGVSSYLSNQEDARAEAKEAALEAVIDSVGLKIDDPAWDGSVRKLYGEARQQKLAAFDKVRAEALKGGSYDRSEYDRAHRSVRSSRTAVVNAFKATADSLFPTAVTDEYEDAGGSGSRFLMFVQYKIDPAQAKRLVARYSDRESALGAVVVTAFPGIAWRYANVESGAMIIALEAGKLRDRGMASESIVLEVQEVPIKDAKAFKRHMDSAVELLTERGGALKLKLKSGDLGDGEFMVPFTKPAAPEIRTRPTGPSNTRPSSNQPPVPWNRPTRDDPTQ